jgi:hypothetical protein
MALNDIYQIVLTQLYQSEPIQNTFYYRALFGVKTAEAVVTGFWDRFDTAYANLQTDQISNYLARCINLGDLSDFHEMSLTGAGANTGEDTMPLHDCINFTKRVNTRAVKPGSVRVSGIPTLYTTEGRVIGDTFIGFVNAFRSLLDDKIVVTSGVEEYQPIVVKRVPYVTPSGRDAHRLPESTGELVTGDVVAALVNLKVSHQSSRGNGR